jgi:hypothetical protein
MTKREPLATVAIVCVIGTGHLIRDLVVILTLAVRSIRRHERRTWSRRDFRSLRWGKLGAQRWWRQD